MIVRSRKKTGIFLTLGLLGLLFLFWVLKTPSQPRRRQILTKTPLAPFTQREQTGSVPKRDSGRLTSSYSSWGRNPFIIEDKGESFILNLKGIIWDESTRLAVINEKVVREGDEVGGRKVIKIEKHRVILNDGQNDFELRLEFAPNL